MAGNHLINAIRSEKEQRKTRYAHDRREEHVISDILSDMGYGV